MLACFELSINPAKIIEDTN